MTATSLRVRRNYDFAVDLNLAGRDRATRLHNECVFWNACDSTDQAYADETYISKIKNSGITAINHTVAYSMSFKEAVRSIATWSKLYEANPDVGFIARNYADVALAKESGRTAIFMGFQDIVSLEDDISLLSVFHNFGIRWVQPTYQYRNLAGDGCGERIQSGLSHFGVRLINELNRLRIVIDVSHVGIGTTLEIIERSAHPVMATHCGASGLVNTPRNKTDEVIKALAARGGVIGIAAKSGFLKSNGLQTGTTMDDFVDHVEYVRDLVGIEHVCIGTDIGDERKYTLERMRVFHSKYPEVAIIGDGLRTDIMHTAGVGPGTLYNVTAGLVKRGFSDQDIRLILGENVNRVLRQVWEG
ncbi:MAG: membrane dipeptidase [Betaproteobacteria bacterium]|nr:membrane dipeptidase [Betaproteobacteria bacterium]